MTDETITLTPWMLCTGVILLCFVAFVLWALFNQPAGGAPSPHARDVRQYDNVPHHSEMQVAHVAAAVNQNLSTHGDPVRGEVHVYRDDAHEVRSNAAWLEAHGHDGDNRVSVIYHKGSR